MGERTDNSCSIGICMFSFFAVTSLNNLIFFIPCHGKQLVKACQFTFHEQKKTSILEIVIGKTISELEKKPLLS